MCSRRNAGLHCLDQSAECCLLQGFGYVEFDSRESLYEAVAMNGTKFKGKDLFIAVSNPTGRGRGGMRGRGRGDLNRGVILKAALCTLIATWHFNA